MEVKVRNIANEFVVLSPKKIATIEQADSTLYQRIAQNYNGFKSHELVAAYEFESDWDTWEIHPNGDEIVLLLSGEITLVLKLPGGLQSVALCEAGSYVVVPKGIWHTAKTRTPSRLLFVTPGEGTCNSESPE